MAFSPDSAQLAIGKWKTVTIHDLTGRRAARQYDLSSGSHTVGQLAFSPDGTFLAARVSVDRHPFNSSGEVHVWNVHTGANVGNWKRSGVTYRSIAFAPNGKRLAAGINSGILLLPMPTEN